MGIDPKIKIADAIDIAGSAAELARALKINRSNITYWKVSGQVYLPALYAYRFERLQVLKEQGEILYFSPTSGLATRVIDPNQPDFEL